MIWFILRVFNIFMSNIIVKKVKNSDQTRWDLYVAQHPEASPYHFYAWCKAIEKSYLHENCSLIAEKNGKIVGIFPLIRICLPFIFNKIVALPYCDVGNCLSDDFTIEEKLISAAIEFSKLKEIDVLDIRGKLQSETRLSHKKLKNITTGKVRMFLELPDSSDELMKSFKSKLRSQIKKAEKNGLKFRWGYLSDLEAIYAVISKNMRCLGSPVHSINFFKEIIIQYGSKCHIGLVEYRGTIVGVGIILTVSGKVSIPWASTLRQYNHLATNMLLYWNLLKYASDNNMKIFDFGRSSEGEGTYRFKKQWGVKPIPLDWYEVDIKKKRDRNDTGNIPLRNIAAVIWQKLPPSISSLIGPAIRKYISL